jgi:hypothetical protein
MTFTADGRVRDRRVSSSWMLARYSAAFRAWMLGRRIAQLRKREEAALARGGAELAAVALSSEDEAVRALLHRLDAARVNASALDGDGARFAAQDRVDYAAAGRWGRVCVVARGLASAGVLRGQRRRAHAALRAIHAELARTALDGSHADLASRMPSAAAAEIETIRRRIDADTRDREECTAAWNGRPLPGWAESTIEHTVGFGRFVVLALRSKLVPRLPALAGLLVAWWIAHSFTDDMLTAQIDRIAATLGIGRQSGQMSQETRARLLFWLPLIATAGCGYALHLFTRWTQRRFGAETTAKAK